jgi:molybdopterin-containing oxidoreductase family iron-sulfur binding subunit
VESCTLCVDKIDNGDNNTACAEACQREGHQAILFGDLNDPNSELSRRLASQPTREIRADLDLNTGVRFAGI